MVQPLFPKLAFIQGVNATTKEITKSKLFVWVKITSPIYSNGQIRTNVNDMVVNFADIAIMEENVVISKIS